MLVPVWATKILLYLYLLPADDQSISILPSWIFSISFKLSMATYALQFFLSILVSRSSEYGLKQATTVSLSWPISRRCTISLYLFLPATQVFLVILAIETTYYEICCHTLTVNSLWIVRACPNICSLGSEVARCGSTRSERIKIKQLAIQAIMKLRLVWMLTPSRWRKNISDAHSSFTRSTLLRFCLQLIQKKWVRWKSSFMHNAVLIQIRCCTRENFCACFCRSQTKRQSVRSPVRNSQYFHCDSCNLQYTDIQHISRRMPLVTQYGLLQQNRNEIRNNLLFKRCDCIESNQLPTCIFACERKVRI